MIFNIVTKIILCPRKVLSDFFFLVFCQTEALEMMQRIVDWVRKDDSGLGREKLAGNQPTSSLAVPMMLLCLIEQLVTMDASLATTYSDTEQWCLGQVQKHVQVC